VHVRPTVLLEGFFSDIHSGFGEGIRSDPTTVRRWKDVAGCCWRRCPCDRHAARQSTAAHWQDLSPDWSAVREHAFVCARVLEGAWPPDHLSRYSWWSSGASYCWIAG